MQARACIYNIQTVLYVYLYIYVSGISKLSKASKLSTVSSHWIHAARFANSRQKGGEREKGRESRKREGQVYTIRCQFSYILMKQRRQIHHLPSHEFTIRIILTSNFPPVSLARSAPPRVGYRSWRFKALPCVSIRQNGLYCLALAISGWFLAFGLVPGLILDLTREHNINKLTLRHWGLRPHTLVTLESTSSLGTHKDILCRSF